MSDRSTLRKRHVYRPPQGAVNLLYADDAIIVANKQAGLLSVPGRGSDLDDCLLARICCLMPDARTVHRLDMATSGVMVFARTADAHRELSMQFEARKVDKIYIACVAGRPESDEGEINAPLICDWPNRPLQKIDPVTGKHALTRWRILDSDGSVTRVELAPLTGRSHQLRVHMAEIGCPILGDEFYAPDPVLQAAPRLMLHAERLALDHPETGDRLTFEAPAAF